MYVKKINLKIKQKKMAEIRVCKILCVSKKTVMLKMKLTTFLL